MSCCQPPDAKKSGCACGGAQPFPWLSALRDPAMGRLFFRRFWREVLLGLGAGALTALAALVRGDGLWTPGGTWVHVHAAAVIPVALLGGLALAFGQDRALAALGRALMVLVLGGLANGYLEAGLALEGMLASALVFGVLGLPVLWLTWRALTWTLRTVEQPDAS